uniref:Uncharacterized protein n=1 Tax=Oryza sativa subsp. japonica TaxID=39947 RepID=Q7XHX0_ORYSJ|nr:hypothetical protein [Oryza sativa Japonica Group]BAD31224.1 hypothetical protein [Oryza sativa Japonica Group]
MSKRPGGAVSRAHHPPTGEWALPPAYTLQLDAAFTPTQRAPIRKEHPSFPFLLLLLLLPAAHSNPPPHLPCRRCPEGAGDNLAGAPPPPLSIFFPEAKPGVEMLCFPPASHVLLLNES